MVESNYKVLCSTRFNLALIAFSGLALVYAMRTNLSFSIVCMVNATAIEMDASSQTQTTNISAAQSCSKQLADIGPSSPKVEGTLVWPKSIQGSILSAFFWGYTCSQVLGGYMASRYGSKLILGFSLLCGSILTLVSPAAAQTNVYAFLIVRALLGFFQGCTYPAFHSMWGVWAPPLERSLLTGISYAGGQIGNMLVLPTSGFFCARDFLGGWPAIYYTIGCCGFVWCAVWFYFAADAPARSRRIDVREKKYIEESLKETLVSESIRKRSKLPWHEIFTSKPVWAIIIGHFAGDWGSYMMLTSMPLFMNNVFGFDLFSLGFFAAIPYIVYFFFINLGGFISDYLRAAKILSTLNTRRLAMLLGLGCQAVFLVAAGYCSCGQETLVIVFLSLSIGLSGFQYAGFIVNYLDIAPNAAGTLLGLGNTLSCLAGAICPLLVGALTPTGAKEEWQVVFWITSGILVSGAVLFSIFASGDIQPWARSSDNDTELCTTECCEPSKNSKSLHHLMDDVDGKS